MKKYRMQLILLFIILIPQLLIMAKNWHSQMLQGNWVELMFLELTFQGIYHYITKGEGEEKTK